MKKFLSFMLAFVMVVTTFVGIIPPLEVSAASSPYVKTFSSDVDEVTVGDTVTFTIKTSANVNGVCLAVRDVNDDESLTIISTNKSSTKKMSFTIEYSFQKTNATDSSGKDKSNTRTVYAFIVDNEGAIIDESDYKEIDIKVNPAKYTFSDFKTYDCHVDIGSRAKIEWDAVSSKDGSTVTYKVYIDDEFYDDTTRTYMYVDAEDIEDYGEGDYWIGVFATAPSHRQKQSSARLYIEEAVDDEKPTIGSIDVSPSLTITEGDTISFSTEATDDTKLSKLTMYIDGDEVKNVSASGTSKSISYSTSSLAVGTHTVNVKATDAAGNTNEVTANITVKSKAVTVDFSKVNVVDEITVGERITWSGTVSVSGSKIDTISVGIMKSSDNGIYYRKTSVGNASYNIANIQSGYIPTGSTAPAGVRPGANAGEWVNYNDFIINTPGTYWIRVSVYTESGETIKSDAYYITVKATPDTTKPIIDPITVNPSLTITEGDTISFSTNASDETKLSKLELYIGNEVKKSVSATGKEKSISFSTSDLAVGTYTVKVKATDAAGNTNEVTANITVKSKAVTVDFSKVNVVDEITVGERITWSGTVSVSGSKIDTISVGIMKSTDNGIYYRKTSVGSASYNIANIQNGYIPTGSTAPAGVRPGANAGEWVNYNDFIINTPGTYWIRISVYTESGETIKSDAYYITVKAAADKTEPLIDPIKLSATKITENSELVISTAASDNVGLKSIQLLINDEKVKEWSAKGTYTNISHTVSGYSVGSYTVKVIAIDQSGNQNSVETTFTVEKKQGGEIYSVEMSSYNFKAGTTITFTVTTSVDTEKIRLRNGDWIFPNDITDSTTKNGKKVWVFEQYVDTPGVNRVLSVETHSNGWTGNLKGVTFTVVEESKDLPSFEIVLPISGQKIQVNTELKLQWSGSSVTPDRYVVNISGPSTYFVETTQTSVIIPASAFKVAGTYNISITSQKAGYNPYESKIVITCICSHQSTKTQILNYYYNNSSNSSTEHSVTCVEELYCSLCGAIFNKTSTYNEKHEQSDETCSCKCGYVFEGATQIMYLNTSFPKNVYSQIGGDGEVIQTSKVGVVYPGQAITVCGSTKDYYIISYDATASRGSTTSRTGYSLSRSATTPYNKIGYIRKDMLAKVPEIDDVYSVVLSDCYVLDYSSLTSLKTNGNILAICDPLKGIDQRDAGTYDFLNGSDKLYITIFKNGKKILAEQFEKEGFTLLEIVGNVELDYSIGIEVPDCIAITYVDMYCEINLIYDDGKSNLMDTVIEGVLVRNEVDETIVGNDGKSFVITDSCIWYNEHYYDYIVNYKEPWWNIYKSTMDESMFTEDHAEAISHILLLSPEDAKELAKYCDRDKLSKAYKAVKDYLIGIVVDEEINSDKIKDGAVKSFLDVLEIDSDSISIDEKELVLKIIGKVFDLDNIIEMIGNGLKPVEIITGGIESIAKVCDSFINLRQWGDILRENAENGRGTTIVFSYDRYGPMYRQTYLYKYESKRYENMATWSPYTESFHGPYYDAACTKIITGYLNYNLADVAACFFEALEDYTFHNIVSK